MIVRRFLIVPYLSSIADTLPYRHGVVCNELISYYKNILHFETNNI